ncbi:MAG: sugar phosphate isomerase/epimerase, partial [Abditibacteriales bacterium]|nr:sugar phosphate isomerase/epimerase [Abditibacteriales bacterium]
MKIGVTQIILDNMTLDDTLNLCHEAGYECVELTFRSGRDLDPDMSEDEIRAVGQRCADAGIHIGSVIATYPDGGNLLSRNAQEREKRKKSLLRSLEIAHLLNVNTTLLHPGQLTVEGTYEQAWNDLRDILRELAALAAEKRVAIGLENVWNKFLLSPKEMREFIDEVGSEWVGVYLDTANMMAYGFPEHWIRSLGRRIKKVHFKDFQRREHRFVPLMDGDTDWATLMHELRAIGYDDCVIHEVSGDKALQIEMAKRMRAIIALASP